MNKPTILSIIGISLSLTFSAGLCAMVGSNGNSFMKIPAFTLCVGLAFILQWIVFIPSYWYKSEKLFDLNGSATYVVLVFTAFMTMNSIQARSVLIGILVSVWAVRLGRFLFIRIQRTGYDSRFVTLKSNFLSFLMVWTLQGFWVTLTFATGLAAMTSGSQEPLGIYDLFGQSLWALGFAIEVVADNQKQQFRSTSENAATFITHGLWSWSRHPNYFGEIILWTGITLIAFPTLTGLGYITLISPIFVLVLLSKVSGIPLLEKQATQRWGNNPAYIRYKSVTPVLIPNPFKRSSTPLSPLPEDEQISS